ncbi:MAG: GtrA family protein [Frankiales bacterium]|nr:GtrA family protein [Frankiales bacterium]
MTGTARRLGRHVLGLRDELAKFGTVGILSLVVDTVVFNLLRDTVLPDKPLTAKIISAVVSATNAFLLNRHWSFNARTKRAMHHEYALFIGINVVGLSFSLACLAVSHYGLGLDSRLADNISANGVGLVLGTMFRFWAYRRFIWLAADTEPAALPERELDPLR